MRAFQIVWVVASVGAAAMVAAFVVLMLSVQPIKLAGPAHQTSATNEPASPKMTARISAPTTLNYYKVKVAFDGTLQTSKQTFRLYAADVPDRQDTCTYRDGRRWACGLRAYVALLNLIGSEPVECRPRDADKPDVVICHHNGNDISEWMLKEGWARLQDGVTDERYVEAAKAASADKIGMWVEAPPPPPPQDVTAQ